MGAREVPRGRDCHVEDLAERGRGDEHATGRRDGAGDGQAMTAAAISLTSRRNR